MRAGEHDIRPQTDEDWRTTRVAAASITEYGNLLMTPLYAEGRGEDWTDFARGLVEIGMRAEQAAIDRNPDAVFEVGDNLYNVCAGCHQLYPPAGSSEGETVSISGEPVEDGAGQTQSSRPRSGVSLEDYQEHGGT